MAPDTIAICHDTRSDQFFLAIEPAARRLDTMIQYRAMDSIITTSDATTITKQAPSWTISNIFDEALRIIGAIAIGFVLGKVW